jgi:hypothetical protein
MSIDIIQITDYDANNDLLMQQFKDKPKFLQVMSSLSKQSEDLEKAIFEVRDLFWLSTAEGVQLDVIGSIHGESRLGRSDTDYRTAIETRIILNNGSGEPETVILFVSSVLGASTVQLNNLGNAVLQIWTDILITTANFNEIEEIIPAGVQLIVFNGSTNPFVFENDPSGLGFSKLEDETMAIDTGTGADVLSVDTGTGAEEMGTLLNEWDPDDGGEFQGVIQTS